VSRDPSIPLLEKFGRNLRPVSLFVGIVVGFSLMVIAGRWAGRQNLFVAYERNYQLISPEGYFYPSLNNLTELVSHVASQRKILVLVGGNSILLGVGQKTEQLWTKDLQRFLGPDFVVVNLAFRGARLTEMGAVVAEVLSKKYPRLIYVANAEPITMLLPAGGLYGYLNWQAQASGKLAKINPGSEEAQMVVADRSREFLSEAALRGYFDYLSYASDLWNYIGYNYLFTVFNSLKTPPERFFEARKNSQDQEGNVPPIPERFTLPEQGMWIIRTFLKSFVKEDAQGELSINRGVSDEFMRSARVAIPDSFKMQTLILLTYNAPFYVNQLSKEEYSAYKFTFSQGKYWLRKAGYNSAIIGLDFTNDDFADRGHLTGSGGQKMARDIAPVIQGMAAQLGYLPAASAKKYP
jgi:lysophospholipase L1-like esterase